MFPWPNQDEGTLDKAQTDGLCGISEMDPKPFEGFSKNFKYRDKSPWNELHLSSKLFKERNGFKKEV